MERKVQEHKQELERLQQATKLDKARLVHEAKLKKEALSVRTCSCMYYNDYAILGHTPAPATHTHPIDNRAHTHYYTYT